MKVSVIIPTYNAGQILRQIYLKIEKFSSIDQGEIIVIDSSSNDGSLDFLQNENVQIISIPKSEFNHGGTRNLAAKKATGDILVYLTQDAVPANEDSIDNLIKPLIQNKDVGMSYGRQLPHNNADVFGAFAREFNYPNVSQVKTIKDKDRLGIKTVFVSNSFAAYRKDSLEQVGGFPTNTILSEDTYVAAKMIKNDLSIAYVADASVYHSHNYSILEEFKRYFDIGVFYGREKWILEDFAQAEGEGARFAINQLRYIVKSKKYHLVPIFFSRNFMKLAGYRLGIHEEKLPLNVKKNLSMHKQYWNM
jgi:rhamnosyltransferase